MTTRGWKDFHLAAGGLAGAAVGRSALEVDVRTASATSCFRLARPAARRSVRGSVTVLRRPDVEAVRRTTEQEQP